MNTGRFYIPASSVRPKCCVLTCRFHIKRFCTSGRQQFSFFSILYLVWQIGTNAFFKKYRKKNRRLFCIGTVFISLYTMCIPMITFMNFSVLTDSFATSMLPFFRWCSHEKIFNSKTVSGSSFAVIVLSMLAEYTLRADRLYTCTLFLVICFISFLIRIRKKSVATPGSKFFRSLQSCSAPDSPAQ